MLLECKDLIKIYPSPVEGLMFPALRGLNFSAKKGQLIAVIGPSGAGKTTFLKLLSGFDTPSAGEIWFEETLLNRYTRTELEAYRSSQVGVMYQSPRDNLIWGLNALDNVLFPIRYSNIIKTQKKQKAYELLAKVGLKGKEKRKPAQLSGGEQQRVAIAVALANNPTLLLADEPTGELDSLTTTLIIDYFRELNQDLGITILVTTHDTRFAKMTDHIYKIQDGRVTTFQRWSKDGTLTSEPEEVVVVDFHGNLRLPRHILDHYYPLNAVKVVGKKGKIELIPFSSKDNNQEEDHT
jgi:ABC-type lipoprotein export system ATPase subunit